jgi:ABC-2 type transport system ATP-binding protein
MSTDVMIQASELSKRFGNVRALDRVSFEVRKGEVVGFLGPNGAGKSTAMRILTCFLSPTSGSARVHGFDVFDDPLSVRRSIGYLPQRAPLYTDMSVIDYLQFAADIRGLDPTKFKKQLSKVIEICGLARVMTVDIGTLSHGYRQRVGLGQALIHDPAILILDEPTADLDPNEKAEVIRYIQEIGRDRTVLLSTHNLSEVEQACARAIIVSKGRIVADGPLDDIRTKTGGVRYAVHVDQRSAEDGRSAPSLGVLRQALEKLPGVQSVRELQAEEGAHRVEVSGPTHSDLRAEIFRLMVSQGWTLLELRRDAQSLDAVFRDLTRADEAIDRGRAWDEALAGADDEDDDDFDDTDDQDDERAEAAASVAEAAEKR